MAHCCRNEATNSKCREYLVNMSASEAQLRENVRVMEKRVVKSTKAIINAGLFLHNIELLHELESDLEWFLTWRLKLADVPIVMWCDGVSVLTLHCKEHLTYEITARAYVGPESGDSKTTLCPLAGTIVLDQTNDLLRSYALRIGSGEEAFVITDVI